MSPKDRGEFVSAIYRLSKLHPATWDAFLVAMDKYVAVYCEDAVQAPIPEALTAHGRAQAYVALRNEFRTAQNTYEQSVRKHP